MYVVSTIWMFCTFQWSQILIITIELKYVTRYYDDLCLKSQQVKFSTEIFFTLTNVVLSKNMIYFYTKGVKCHSGDRHSCSALFLLFLSFFFVYFALSHWRSLQATNHYVALGLKNTHCFLPLEHTQNNIHKPLSSLQMVYQKRIYLVYIQCEGFVLIGFINR